MWLFTFTLVALFAWRTSASNCRVPEGMEGVCTPGDVIIGGLFPVHQMAIRQNDPLTPDFHGCAQCNAEILRQVKTMIYAIKQINNSPMLPNISLGYEIYDTCADPSMAIKAGLKLMLNQNQAGVDCATLEHTSEAGLKVVIGELTSRLSAVIARLLALPLITQISYGSSSKLLSSKVNFPSFVRTVPPDTYQSEAMVKMIEALMWQSVGIIGSDDEYGLYGAQGLSENLSDLKICENFQIILPSNFSLNNSETRDVLGKVMEKIRNSTTEVIVVFTAEANAIILMEEVIRQGVKKNWIASDAWSTSTRIANISGIQTIGKVFGFIWKTGEVPGLKECFQNNTNDCFDDSSHISIYSRAWNCSTKDTMQESVTAEQYNIYMAVQVIGHALSSLLKCNSEECERHPKFSAWELLQEVKKVNFTLNGIHISFNKDGDPNLGYNILQWVTENQNPPFQTIGMYDTNNNITLPVQLVTEHANVTMFANGCYKNCTSGFKLVQSNNSCCNVCVRCETGTFSTGGGKACQTCPSNMYPSTMQDSCVNKTQNYIYWSTGPGVALAVCAALGLLLTLLVGVLLLHHWDTPVVKSAGGPGCFIVLVSLCACFCSIFSCIGQPTWLSCQLGLPVFSMAFTLCIAYIIANLFQIFIAFMFQDKTAARLRPLNRPFVIAGCLTSIQWTLCFVWIIVTPRRFHQLEENASTLLTCDMGSTAIFNATLGYNAFLCAICLLFAFKGRRLPDLYKNASFLTISMLIYLVVWIIFISVYMNMSGKYMLSIEAIAMLVSIGSLLCCHFGPKCYIILFRKDINDEKVIVEHIRKHCERKGIPTVSTGQ